MQSVMTHSFSNVPTINIPRSTFKRDFAHKTCLDAGWLVPLAVDEVLPGDTFNVQSTIFARMSTPEFAPLDNLHLDTHWFYCPSRLLWTNFRRMMGEQDNPSDSIDYTVPILEGAVTSDSSPDLSGSTGRKGALLNYMGIPGGLAPDDVDINALPFRMYEFVYDQWFRDQNLIDSKDIQLDDGPDDMDAAGEMYQLQRRGKRHDYFTSCLPNPQKGSDAVSLPLGTSAPVGAVTAGTSYPTFSNAAQTDTLLLQSNNPGANVDTIATPTSTTTLYWKGDNTGLEADLTSATAATINDLREAFQTQKLLERDARAGTRYHEILRNHFGINLDWPAYRPEYLGGNSQPIHINPVVQTGHGGDTIPSTYGSIGDIKSFGTAMSNSGFTKSFQEHGYIMLLVSVRADLTYQQGIDKLFSRSTRYDFYWPSLAHLGEEPVYNKEIYAQGNANDDLVFGYQERYASYRYKKSQVSNLFESNATGTLDPWHFSQKFTSLPSLGETFIEENPPIDRTLRVDTEPHFILDSFHKMTCARPMPVYGVPGMIDHF